MSKGHEMRPWLRVTSTDFYSHKPIGPSLWLRKNLHGPFSATANGVRGGAVILSLFALSFLHRFAPWETEELDKSGRILPRKSYFWHAPCPTINLYP